MIRHVLPLLALLVAVALPPAAAQAQSVCPKELVVDGRVLERVRVQHEVKLPELEGERDAAIPTCDAEDPTEPTTVKTFADVPAAVAVMFDDDLYVAAGSLVQMSGHPVHDAVYQTASEPSYRRNECRPEPGTVDGTVVDDGSLTIQQKHGTVRLVVDAQTRYVDRPPTQPLIEGQKVSVRTSRCGPRHVADAITLVDGPLPARTFEPKAPVDEGTPGWLTPVGIAVAVAAAGIVAMRRRRTTAA
jgi:hypothetical protein